MKFISRLLAVSLVMGTFASHAAYGVTVSRIQEAEVHIGMTSEEVRELLGCPADVFSFRALPGPSWSYGLVGTSGTIVFDVDFDANGRVIYARERTVQRG